MFVFLINAVVHAVVDAQVNAFPVFQLFIFIQPDLVQVEVYDVTDFLFNFPVVRVIIDLIVRNTIVPIFVPENALGEVFCLFLIDILT